MPVETRSMKAAAAQQSGSDTLVPKKIITETKPNKKVNPQKKAPGSALKGEVEKNKKASKTVSKSDKKKGKTAKTTKKTHTIPNWTEVEVQQFSEKEEQMATNVVSKTTSTKKKPADKKKPTKRRSKFSKAEEKPFNEILVVGEDSNKIDSEDLHSSTSEVRTHKRKSASFVVIPRNSIRFKQVKVGRRSSLLSSGRGRKVPQIQMETEDHCETEDTPYEKKIRCGGFMPRDSLLLEPVTERKMEPCNLGETDSSLDESTEPPLVHKETLDSSDCTFVSAASSSFCLSPTSYDITAYEDSDLSDLIQPDCRENKKIPRWAQNDDMLHCALFVQKFTLNFNPFPCKSTLVEMY